MDNATTTITTTTTTITTATNVYGLAEELTHPHSGSGAYVRA